MQRVGAVRSPLRRLLPLPGMATPVRARREANFNQFPEEEVIQVGLARLVPRQF